MSQTKRFKSILFAIFTIFAFFAFGCEKGKVAVTNINIKLENQSQVVLLVDEFFNLGECVEVYPNYANDKTFSIYSMNENVVRVVGNQIKAISVGEAMVRVVSNTNENIEDVISVVVQEKQTQLVLPENFNLAYNKTSQTFTFNPVENAASYTININGRDFNIGNINAFELKDYNGEKFNNVLSVKVKANASSYGKAFADSDYSSEIKIYQINKISDAQIVGGKLTFTKNLDLVYDVYFNDTLFAQNLTENEIDLTNLTDSYAGLRKNVKIVAKMDEGNKQSGVDYYSSSSDEIVLNILNEPNLNLIGNVISWDSIPFANAYKVFIENNFVAEIQDNYFDLSSWENFNQLSNEEVVVRVESVLKETTKNVAKTQKSSSLKFSRLATPVISTTQNGFEWTSVDNALSYGIKLTKNGVSEFVGSTTSTSFDLSKFGAGQYNIEVYANGNNDVNNLLSSKTASATITKHTQVNAEIADYVLKITTIPNEMYNVKFTINDNNSYNENISATSDKIEIDLSVYNFNKGLNSIEITQLGNNTNSINGEVKIVSFTQLEAVNIQISNSIASITRNETNKNAEIYLEIRGGALTESIKNKTDSYQINTTDPSKAYLSAGSYSVVAYVEGDGSSTFSYRDVNSVNKKQALACGERTFEVLSVPSLSVQDFSKPELTINKVNNTSKYSILDESEQILDGNVSEKYSFTLSSGQRKQFKVKANGNGNVFLDSLCSDLIVVERLTTPELLFDANNDSFSVDYKNNNSALYEKVNFYFKSKLEEYSFGSTFENLETGDNNFKINLVSKGVVGGINYINSLDNSIKVRKLRNNLVASIDSNNKLNITNSQAANLVLKFDFDSNEYLLENNQIKIDGYILNYVASSGKYIITLLDDDFKAIIPDMADGFKVQTKFLREDVVNEGGIKVYYTNSDWSDESAELVLNRLNAASSIYTDTNNKIIIENPNNQQLYLDLTINGVAYTDNGNSQLINGETILTYTYSARKYYIDLYKDGNINLKEIEQGDNLNVKVKFKKNVAGSNIDSAYSTEKTIQYLIAPTFIRENQILSFVSTYSGYELDKYKVIINNSIKMSMTEFAAILSSSAVGELTKYSVDMSNLWSVFGSISTSVNSLKIEILNSATTSENSILGAIGTEIYVQQSETFEIETEKVNGLTNVKVDWLNTDYAKVYSLDILGYSDYSTDILKNLDELIFSGNLTIEGYVKVNSNYVDDNGKIVEVFNSKMSDSVVVTRLAVPTLSVSDNKIHYTTISGANGYEVYLLTDGVYQKVDESRLNRTGGSFMFNDLAETDEFTIKVKAITTNSEIINSNLSDAIVVKKIGPASASLVGGQVRIILPDGCKELIEDENVSVKLALNFAGRVYECDVNTDYIVSINNFVVEDIVWNSTYNAFVVNSGLIFGYTEGYIVEKQLSVQLKLSGTYARLIENTEDSYIYENYLYSDVKTGAVKGLFAPTNVKISKDGDFTANISWQNNQKNKLENGNIVDPAQYVFAFIYQEKVYYSTEEGLKYKTSEGYSSYGTITSTSVPFPYGYDANKDGDFIDDGDVIFATGEFMVAVAAASEGYANSPYSELCSFTIMGTTTPSFTDGKLTWTEVAGATSYIIRIKQGANIVKTAEVTPTTASDYVYNFEDFDLSNDLFSVTIQAITKATDKLNSKESSSLMFYRLPSALAIEYDDGMLKISASQFVNEIHLTYNGILFRFTNEGQKESLTNTITQGIMSGKTALESVQDASFGVYLIDLAKVHPALAGTSGQIKLSLTGNTGVINVPTLGDVGLVSSKSQISSTTIEVLSSNVNEVDSGVWTFNKNAELGLNENFATINYNFNNVANDSLHSFWKNAVVYEILVEASIDETTDSDIIYAVDYFRFISAINAATNPLTTNTNAQTYYELLEDKNGLYARIICKYGASLSEKIYFNVYLNNIIDLQNYDTLFYYPIVKNGLTYTYQTKEGTLTAYETIDLEAGGVFTINIRTLGGDGVGVYTYLNAPNVLQKFVRFGKSFASTKDGYLVFADMKVDGFVSPVYKITIKQPNTNNVWYVYLYDDAECEEAQVRSKFKLSDAANILCVPVIELNSTQENESGEEFEIKQIAFDMGKYITNGASYNVWVKALAGVGANGYVLNAKEPLEDDKYLVKIFTTPNVEIKNGNIEFDLSSINNDGKPENTYEYEIVVGYDDGTEYKEYSEKITNSSDGVLVEGSKLTYTLPLSIGDLNVVGGANYTLQARALTSRSGLINSKFDDSINFTRNISVQSVKIEDGILKWSGDGNSNTIYQIKILNNNNNDIILIDNIRTTTYTFAEQEFAIVGSQNKTQILPNTNYTISISKVGNSESVISSAYTDCTGVYRIDNVKLDEIVANASGLLQWTNISNASGYDFDASGYYLEMVNTNNANTYIYTIEGNVDSIDLSSEQDDIGRILPAGNYKAKIRVLSKTEKLINSLLVQSDLVFTKLEQVKFDEVEFEGEFITWTAVTNATDYKIRFVYTNNLGENTNAETTKFDEYETESGQPRIKVKAPGDVRGKLTIYIVAYGESSSIIKSDVCEVQSSKDAPLPVVELHYNNELNRFEWKTQNDFINTDKLIVKYNFVEFTKDGYLAAVEIDPITISYHQAEYYDSVNDVYYLPISIMGKYNDFKVAVRREGTNDAVSSPINWELNLFNYGAGTETNPYVLNSEQSLLNMQYYPTAYYKVISDIEISSAYTQAIQQTEFGGYINGEKSNTENYKINLGNIVLENVQEFALFKKLNGATITNLDLTGNITNIITSNSEESGIVGDVKIAILAVESNNSTLTNVRILSSSITLVEKEENVSNEVDGNMYISGFIAKDSGSTLSKSYILGDSYGLAISLNLDLSGNVYFGAVAAYAETTSVLENSDFKIQINNAKQTIRYLGGMFGYYVGSLDRTKGVFNSSITINVNNIKAVYVGGVAGYAKYISVENSDVYGMIQYPNIGNQDIYLGGIVGFAESSVLANNTLYADLIVSLQTTSGTIRIGKIAGFLKYDSSSGLVSELSGNYSDERIETDYKTNGEHTLGLCGGKSEEGVTITTNN